MRQKMTSILVLTVLLSLVSQDALCQRRNAQQQRNFEARYIPKGIRQVPKNEQICFALYTVNEHILKLTAQLYPLEADDPRVVRLEVKRNGKWKKIAEAEVRRSVAGDYSPLYQAAYMLGGLQFRALHRELVESGEMTAREFHDAVLYGGPMPVELVRARLSGAPLDRSGESRWRFGGDPDGR